MTRRAILHIGTEKTGTTTLQHSLAVATDTLAKHGFHYPLLGAGHAQVALVSYAKSAGPVADLPVLGGQGADESRAAFDARIEAELAAQVSENPDATFILSSEHASSRLNDGASIHRLKTLLDRHFDTVDIMIYLRRWDRMAISAHATFVRNGDTAPFSFERFNGSQYLDYTGMLSRWAAVFQEARLHVGIYDRAELRDGSIVADFCARFGLPTIPTIGEINASPDADTVAMLVLLNRLLISEDALIASGIRDAVVAARRHPGAAVSPVLRREAEAFVAGYADQAEAIRAHYFPDRARLFNERFEDYPGEKPEKTRNWRDISQALVGAVGALAKSQLTIAAEADSLRARLHLEAGRVADARSDILRAIGVRPGNGGYHYILARIEMERADLDAARRAARRAVTLDPDNDAHRTLVATLG